MKKSDWFILILAGAFFVAFGFRVHKQWRIDHQKPVASSNTPVAAWPSDTTISSHPIVPSDQPIVGKISYFCFGATAMFPCSQADFLAQGQEQQSKQIASLQSQVAKLREQVNALQPTAKPAVFQCEVGELYPGSAVATWPAGCGDFPNGGGSGTTVCSDGMKVVACPKPPAIGFKNYSGGTIVGDPVCEYTDTCPVTDHKGGALMRCQQQEESGNGWFAIPCPIDMKQQPANFSARRKAP